MGERPAPEPARASASGSAAEPGPATARAAAPAWIQQATGDSFSWSQALGGPRGVVESVAPGLVFVVVYALTRSLVWTLAAALGVALVACAARLLARQPLTQAASGVLGVGIGVLVASLSGRAEDYFVWGIATNAASALALAVSLVVRQPLVGLAVGLLYGVTARWREPRMRPLARRCAALTWLWFGVFALRVAAQAPLWALGLVAPLGIVKIVLGLPLFAVAGWATWMGLRPHAASLRASGGQPDGQ